MAMLFLLRAHQSSPYFPLYVCQLAILDFPETTSTGTGRRKIPQVAETKTPRLMDAAGESLLYYESRRNVYLLVHTFQSLQFVIVLNPTAMNVMLGKKLKLKEIPHEEVQ